MNIGINKMNGLINSFNFSFGILFLIFGSCNGLICEHYANSVNGDDHFCNETVRDF